MADDEVRLRVKVSGGRLGGRMLASAMREEGVQVLACSDIRDDVETRDLYRLTLGNVADAYVIIQGTAWAIKAGLAKFRHWRPESKVEIAGEDGDKLDVTGYL